MVDKCWACDEQSNDCTCVYPHRFMIHIYDEGGQYWAAVPEEKGLYATGDTLKELLEALAEAAVTYAVNHPISMRDD